MNFFGGQKAADIRLSDIQEYIERRQGEGAANASINRELAALKRMFTLARQGEELVYRPHIPMLDEDNARQGFVDHGGFLAILNGLRDYLKDVAWFLYLTGLRISAVRRLEHRHVDWEGKIIMLPQELAQNKKGQPIPIRGELLELMERARANRVPNCPYLFHHDGRQIGDFSQSCIQVRFGSPE